MTKVNFELDLTDKELEIFDQIVNVNKSDPRYDTREKNIAYLIRREIERLDKAVVNLTDLSIVALRLDADKNFVVTICVNAQDCYDIIANKKDDVTIESEIKEYWKTSVLDEL